MKSSINRVEVDNLGGTFDWKQLRGHREEWGSKPPSFQKMVPEIRAKTQ